MVVAAAGGHNILLIGAPGTGKSMLAKRLPGILPPHDPGRIHRDLQDLFRRGAPAPGRRADLGPALPQPPPLGQPRRPGGAGGSTFRPGECSLANAGVLFLDELPEFPRESLEVLRQPMEDGRITISRAAGSATYPSRFQLVAAMNPCKCGYFGHPTRRCTCSLNAVWHYRSRISGPLLDRIDLCVEMDPVSFNELHGTGQSETSAQLRQQVLAARAIQTRRFARHGCQGVHCNAQLTAGQVRQLCRLTPGAQQVLRTAYDRLGLSARSHDRLLRVARTIADLAGTESIQEEALLEPCSTGCRTSWRAACCDPPPPRRRQTARRAKNTAGRFIHSSVGSSDEPSSWRDSSSLRRLRMRFFSLSAWRQGQAWPSFPCTSG